MIKRLIILLVGLCLATFATAQILNPVHFNYSVVKKTPKTIELHMTATMDKGWHIYSQIQPKEAISEPTKIAFNKNPLVAATGKAKEIGKKEMYRDKVAGIKQYQYGDKVDFVQVINLKLAVKTNVSGTITYQTCTNEMCLPPKTITFSIPLQ